jgi:hypothetical protein
VNSGGPEWTKRYEALRAHAMGEAPLAFVPLGLALLWHRGVMAWIAAEVSAIDVEGVGQQPARKKATAPLAAPRSELVRLLAGTALLVARERAS